MLCMKTGNTIFRISYTGNGPETEIFVNGTGIRTAIEFHGNLGGKVAS